MNRLFAIAKRHVRPLIIFNGLLLAGLLWTIHNKPQHWQASAKLIVPPTSGRLDVSLGKLGQVRGADLEMSQQLNPLSLLSSILLSEDSMTQLWQTDPKTHKFNSSKEYSKLFAITPTKSTSILTLSVEGSEPDLTQQRLERVMGQFWQRLDQLRLEEAQGRRLFSHPQVLDAQARLAQAQKELTQFQQASGLLNDAAQARMLVETLHQLKRHQKELQATQISSQAQRQLLQERLDLTPQQAIQALTLDADESYRRLQQRITELSIKIAQQRTLYTDQHSQVTSLLTERKQLLAQLAARQGFLVGSASTRSVSARPEAKVTEQIAAQPVSLLQQLILADSMAQAQQQEAEVLQAQIIQMEKQLSVLPQQQAQLNTLEREYEIAEDIYNGLVTQNRASNFNTFSAYPNVQLLDQPNIHAKPVGPKLSFMLLGTLLASGFGSLALTLLLESRNPLLTPADVFAADLPVLGLIPQLLETPVSLPWSTAPDLAFQRLASNISMMQLTHNRILVSSAAVGEGKTTVTLGLAQALVALGFKVLLVDGDFYQAGLTRCLQQVLWPNGLAKVAQQSREQANSPISISSKLDFIQFDIHHQQAMEFVARGNFSRALEQAEAIGSYDYILVDSAPVGLTSETPLIGSSIHHLLFVARGGFSERDQVYRSLAEFSRHRVQLLGLLINEAGKHHAPYRPCVAEQPHMKARIG